MFADWDLYIVWSVILSLVKQITGHKNIELSAALEIARGFDNMGFVSVSAYRRNNFNANHIFGVR